MTRRSKHRKHVWRDDVSWLWVWICLGFAALVLAGGLAGLARYHW